MACSSNVAWRLRALRSATLVFAALAGGCAAGDGKGLDANGRPPAESGAGLPPAAAGSFKAVQDNVFTPICTTCHSGASAPLGLRLDAANSYALLVNVPSVEVGSLKRVAPGDPANSYLVQKIEGRASVGARMPLGGPALSQANIDLVRAWIASGAPVADTGGAVASAPFAIASTIPAEGESAAAGMGELTLVFTAGVDASLASAGTIELTGPGGAPLRLESITVTPLNPTVVKLRTAAPLAPGDYALAIRGSGPTPLADVDARALDGDGDGRAGGDFELHFSTRTGEAR
ncbi:MAG: hypothetical protein U1F11_02925 [Steroidobacteraceae bacterium]